MRKFIYRVSEAPLTCFSFSLYSKGKKAAKKRLEKQKQFMKMSETGEFSAVNPWNIISASDKKYLIMADGKIISSNFPSFFIILAILLARWFPIVFTSDTFSSHFFVVLFLIPHASVAEKDLKAHLKAFLTPHLHNKHEVVNERWKNFIQQIRTTGKVFSHRIKQRKSFCNSAKVSLQIIHPCVVLFTCVLR